MRKKSGPKAPPAAPSGIARNDRTREQLNKYQKEPTNDASILRGKLAMGHNGLPGAPNGIVGGTNGAWRHDTSQDHIDKRRITCVASHNPASRELARESPAEPIGPARGQYSEQPGHTWNNKNAHQHLIPISLRRPCRPRPRNRQRRQNMEITENENTNRRAARHPHLIS